MDEWHGAARRNIVICGPPAGVSLVIHIHSPLAPAARYALASPTRVHGVWVTAEHYADIARGG